MLDITPEKVDKVFRDYLAAFDALAGKEDELSVLQREVGEYKEGSAKQLAAIDALKTFEASLVSYQRDLRRAYVEVDRLRISVDLMNALK